MLRNRGWIQLPPVPDDPDDAAGLRYQVECNDVWDGQVRHTSGTFAWLSEARLFASIGHRCHHNHTIRPVPVPQER